MRSINRYKSHLDDEVLAAPPLKLIQMLYRAALEAIAGARRFVRQGDIRSRSRAITKTLAIVNELSLSLDPAAGGELSANLRGLYTYVAGLLIRANAEQCEPPLIEAERLLATLAEAWAECARGQSPIENEHEPLSTPRRSQEAFACGSTAGGVSGSLIARSWDPPCARQ